MTKAQELGKFAEDKAADYVLSLGWKVLARNVRNQYGEIDIASVDDKELVIVEVRCRTLGKVQSPLDSIGPKKLNSIVKASREFINSIDWPDFWRIDVIGITINDKAKVHDWELTHIKDITGGMNIMS